MKLSLYHPIKPALINQKFGNPGSIYANLGIVAHNGIDYIADEGQPIRASHDGIVTYAGEDGAGGLTVVVRTETQFDYKDGESFFKTIYCHLQKGSFKVKASDKVKTGDILALADNTGMSTGTHLHFGFKPVYPGEEDWKWFNLEQENGYKGAIDPEPYFNGFYAEDAVKVGIIKEMLNLCIKLYEILAGSKK